MTYLTREEKEVHCPLEYGMGIFGGKWKPRIIYTLASEDSMRYGDIKRELVNLSDTVLSSSLKELVADSIVNRRQHDTIPPKVEYSLSDKGRTVVPILQSICAWSGQYVDTDEMHKLAKCQRCEYIHRCVRFELYRTCMSN